MKAIKKIVGYHIYVISQSRDPKKNGKIYYYRRDCCPGSVPYVAESPQLFVSIPDTESLAKAFYGHYEAPTLLEEAVKVEVIKITETINLAQATQSEVESSALAKFHNMPEAERAALVKYLELEKSA